jgi:hypothetical protein
MNLRRIAVGVIAFIIAVPLICVIGVWIVLAAKGEPYLARATDSTPRTFVARTLLVATDADMVGTSYADGILHPLDGTHDAVSRIDTQERKAHSADVLITNSVVSWPGTLELSHDAQHAYVVESRGAAPARVVRVPNVHKDLAVGRLLTTLDVSSSGKPTIVRQDDIAIDPTSVHVAPNGAWLAIASRDPAFPLSFAILEGGVPVEIRHPRLKLPAVAPPPQAATDVESLDGISYARIAPDGRTIALHVQSRYLILGEVLFDEGGHPIDIRLGDLTEPAKCMSVGRWSADSRFYVVSDTQWGPTPGDTFIAGAGQLVSIAVDELSATVVSRATVSLSPEGMEMSRDGSLFVAVNMERTYTPETFPFDFVPRRKQASLSLVAFDLHTGTLRTVDGPVAFDAVLPEDAVFDADANMLAVAVFNARVGRPTEGWIEMFAIDRSTGPPRIVPTGMRIRTPRGAHDLAVAY